METVIMHIYSLIYSDLAEQLRVSQWHHCESQTHFWNVRGARVQRLKIINYLPHICFLNLNNGPCWGNMRYWSSIVWRRRQMCVRGEEEAEHYCERASGVSNGELLLQRKGACRLLTFYFTEHSIGCSQRALNLWNIVVYFDNDCNTNVRQKNS